MSPSFDSLSAYSDLVASDMLPSLASLGLS